MKPIISIENINKIYKDGFQALKDIQLEIEHGEIFALLGPNGAGKTTLISLICGIVSPTSGKVNVDGFDIIKDYKKTRAMIGLVPQELVTDMFETVWNTVSFSRRLFGKGRNDEVISKILKDLSLYDKRNNKLLTLSGGMKRRVLIAKALSHEPKVLFLDEPTAGVDVNLRRDMWSMVRKLREQGVTIILTTHYIEEAQEMADRIGIINHGQIRLVEKKKDLMQKLGRKHLNIHLERPLSQIPEGLLDYNLKLTDEGQSLIYDFNPSTQSKANGSSQAGPSVASLLKALETHQIQLTDLQTKESSLEEIFINLVEESQS